MVTKTHILHTFLSIAVHIHTLNEPYQSSFGSGPRPLLQLGLGTVVWCAPKCDCCIHTCLKDPHQDGKRTWVHFNRTKQDWKFTPPQAILYFIRVQMYCRCRVNFFLVSLLKQILRNLALQHFLTNESSAVNGCRQNACPNSFFPNCESVIHNNASSSEKVHPLLSHQNPPTYLFRNVLDCFHL